MINITTNNTVTAVEYGGDPRRYQPGGISDELRLISDQLKEGLEGFCAWIQLYSFIPGSGAPFLESAARELNRVIEYFAECHSRLITYIQCTPLSRDILFAQEIEKALDKLFHNDLLKETMCEITGFGWTSWGERIDPLRPSQWTPEMVQQVLAQLDKATWHKAREIIFQIKTLIP